MFFQVSLVVHRRLVLLFCSCIIFFFNELRHVRAAFDQGFLDRPFVYTLQRTNEYLDVDVEDERADEQASSGTATTWRQTGSAFVARVLQELVGASRGGSSRGPTWYVGEQYQSPFRLHSNSTKIQRAVELGSERQRTSKAGLEDARAPSCQNEVFALSLGNNLIFDRSGVVEVGVLQNDRDGGQLHTESSTLDLDDGVVLLSPEDDEDQDVGFFQPVGKAAQFRYSRWSSCSSNVGHGGDDESSFSTSRGDDYAARDFLTGRARLRIRFPHLVRNMWRHRETKERSPNTHESVVYPSATLDVRFKSSKDEAAENALDDPSGDDRQNNDVLVQSLRLTYLAARSGSPGVDSRPQPLLTTVLRSDQVSVLLEKKRTQHAQIKSIHLHRDLRIADRALLYVGAADYEELVTDRTNVFTRYKAAWFFEADPVTYAKLQTNLRVANKKYGGSTDLPAEDRPMAGDVCFCASSRIVNEQQDGTVDFRVHDWQAIDVVQERFGWDFRMGSLLETKMPEEGTFKGDEGHNGEEGEAAGGSPAFSSFDEQYNATVLQLPTTTLSTIMRGIAFGFFTPHHQSVREKEAKSSRPLTSAGQAGTATSATAPLLAPSCCIDPVGEAKKAEANISFVQEVEAKRSSTAKPSVVSASAVAPASQSEVDVGSFDFHSLKQLKKDPFASSRIPPSPAADVVGILQEQACRKAAEHHDASAVDIRTKRKASAACKVVHGRTTQPSQVLDSGDGREERRPVHGAKNKIQFDLIIDVQGAELSVLAGIEQDADWERIGSIGIEITTLEYKSFPTYIGGAKFPDVDNLLTKRGFVLQPTWQINPAWIFGAGWKYQAAEVVSCNRVTDLAFALERSKRHLFSLGLPPHQHGLDHKEPVFSGPPGLPEAARTQYEARVDAINRIVKEAQAVTALLEAGTNTREFVQVPVFGDGFLAEHLHITPAGEHAARRLPQDESGGSKNERSDDVDAGREQRKVALSPEDMRLFPRLRTLARKLGTVLRLLRTVLRITDLFVRPDLLKLIQKWGLERELLEDLPVWEDAVEESVALSPLERKKKLEQEQEEQRRSRASQREGLEERQDRLRLDDVRGKNSIFDNSESDEEEHQNPQTVARTLELVQNLADARYLCHVAWIPSHGDAEYSRMHLLQVGRHFVQEI
ncbi:unnamed protein product [Amoebophrya sp. A120]|nr:unnamed protein product [Amoebophrya sp. A120]|eukprot:GSA120T00006509001.1